MRELNDRQRKRLDYIDLRADELRKDPLDVLRQLQRGWSDQDLAQRREDYDAIAAVLVERGVERAGMPTPEVGGQQ